VCGVCVWCVCVCVGVLCVCGVCCVCVWCVCVCVIISIPALKQRSRSLSICCAMYRVYGYPKLLILIGSGSSSILKLATAG
jgi:hypothetical protein